MTTKPRHPDTGQPIKSAAEYAGVVERIVDAQPILTPDISQQTPEVPQPAVDINAHMAEILARVRARGAAGRKALEGFMEGPTDVMSDLGGARKTFIEKGYIPTGRLEDAITEFTRTRGGVLVQRVFLAGNYIDVRVNENGSNAMDIERAKEQLVRGQGVSVAALKRKPRK